MNATATKKKAPRIIGSTWTNPNGETWEVIGMESVNAYMVVTKDRRKLCIMNALNIRLAVERNRRTPEEATEFAAPEKGVLTEAESKDVNIVILEDNRKFEIPTVIYEHIRSSAFKHGKAWAHTHPVTPETVCPLCFEPLACEGEIVHAACASRENAG
jgi:hypothetical protein